MLVIDKAPDMTSHDVVAIARRALNTKKIGHCGTLDPMATGLLMLVIGRATKIQDLLMSEDKEYEGTMTLGATTSTQDRQGEVQETREVPAFTAEQIDAAFARYTGDFEQIPPMVSAIKKDGVPLYKLARKGQTIEREDGLKVFITIHPSFILRIPDPADAAAERERFLGDLQAVRRLATA